MHHDLDGFFEKNGILEFRNKIIDPKTGCYKAEIWKDGRKIKNISSFFPCDWNREQVIDKIIEAYENIEKKIIDPKGTITIEGLTKDKIKIKMVIEKSGKITTAYPLL